jgi:predicted dehydrogenase
VGAWWPTGHIIGWEHTFVHEVKHFFDCVVAGKSVAPEGADFEDGYRASVVSDAILESARTGQRVAISY